MFLVLAILAVFGNTIQLQNKYDYCKGIEFKGDYCSVQKKLNESAK